MNKFSVNRLLALTILATWSLQGSAALISVTFNKISGLTGGIPANTAVFKANLSSIGLDTLLSISISDESGGSGGAAGQFSGFDLDAIKLSTTDCTDASCVSTLTGLNVFDFTPAGTIFSPGTQRAPTDTKLFGTNASGNQVDNVVATLQAFDANSTTVIPGALGFVSMGDLGRLIFNLTSPVATTGLYLYIGEVGDNGELAGSSIRISDTIQGVPVPGTISLLSLGIAGLGVWGASKKNSATKNNIAR